MAILGCGDPHTDLEKNSFALCIKGDRPPFTVNFGELPAKSGGKVVCPHLFALALTALRRPRSTLNGHRGFPKAAIQTKAMLGSGVGPFRCRVMSGYEHPLTLRPMIIFHGPPCFEVTRSTHFLNRQYSPAAANLAHSPPGEERSTPAQSSRRAQIVSPMLGLHRLRRALPPNEVMPRPGEDVRPLRPSRVAKGQAGPAARSQDA